LPHQHADLRPAAVSQVADETFQAHRAALSGSDHGWVTSASVLQCSLSFASCFKGNTKAHFV
jgi:hypothetical protein